MTSSRPIFRHRCIDLPKISPSGSLTNAVGILFQNWTQLLFAGSVSKGCRFASAKARENGAHVASMQGGNLVVINRVICSLIGR